MTNAAVIGSFFGDEAKARIVHWLAPKYKYIIRFSGSSNAGHTIYKNGKKIVRHLLPSADFTVNNYAVLASGMVINTKELLKEVQDTENMFPGSSKRIIVDPDAFVITDKHLLEDKENVIKFGSTGKGVSVAYREKIYRHGTKIQDILETDQNLIELKNMGVQFKYNLEMFDEFSSNQLLFEGAQAALLDINFGTYPYVTSGECTPGGIFNSGFSYAMPEKIYGIAKAYATRVGEGPFPTEIKGSEADFLREKGAEYGATTGRPRRVGWLDLPALNFAIKKCGITDLVITKMDVLDNFDSIKIATSYENNLVCGKDFFNAKPQYQKLSGWKNSKNKNETREFLDTINSGTKTKISYLSCGVNDEDIISL